MNNQVLNLQNVSYNQGDGLLDSKQRTTVICYNHF